MKFIYQYYSTDSIPVISERLSQLVARQHFFYSIYYGWVDGAEFYLRKRALPYTGFAVNVRGLISSQDGKNKITVTVRPAWDFYVTASLILIVICATTFNGQFILVDVMKTLGYLTVVGTAFALALAFSIHVALDPIKRKLKNVE